jgi:hypothetical protein
MARAVGPKVERENMVASPVRSVEARSGGESIEIGACRMWRLSANDGC